MERDPRWLAADQQGQGLWSPPVRPLSSGRSAIRHGSVEDVSDLSFGGMRDETMMSRKWLPWYLHGALILAAAVAISGLLGNLWLFALFLVGFVLVMVLMMHIMHGGSPTDSTDEHNRRPTGAGTTPR
ncbi:MAG TPA: hypothetical protein VN306_10470 [Mycobacterium sp.]|nr:hypothetical protein [Mycobacterium sp.]